MHALYCAGYSVRSRRNIEITHTARRSARHSGRADRASHARLDRGSSIHPPAIEHFSVIFPVSLRARRIVHTVFALAPWVNRLKNALVSGLPAPYAALTYISIYKGTIRTIMANLCRCRLY